MMSAGTNTRTEAAAAELAVALQGRRSGRGWVARCPAHRDRHPSLSIAEGADGRLLLRCFAGCNCSAIRNALAARSLWPERGSCPLRPQGTWEPSRIRCSPTPEPDQLAFLLRGDEIAALTATEAAVRPRTVACQTYRRKARDPLHAAESCLVWELS
jgi:hypothetical protein